MKFCQNAKLKRTVNNVNSKKSIKVIVKQHCNPVNLTNNATNLVATILKTGVKVSLALTTIENDTDSGRGQPQSTR